MKQLPIDGPELAVERRGCVACGTEWTAVDASAPERCPECGGDSYDTEVRAALNGMPEWAVEAIRRDERQRLATLIEEHAETISRFAGDGAGVARLVSFMVSLER